MFCDIIFYMLGIEILMYFSIFLGLYFSIFLLSVFFENREKIYKGLKSKDFSSVALIVPCYNEAKNIGKTLNSLLNLDYPKEKLEIIVVDDGSDDKTFEKVKAFQKRDKRIKVFRKENGGKYTALNLGLSKTNAEFIGSVDGDSYLDAQALKKVMKFFEDLEVKAVISTIKIRQVTNIIEGIQYVEYLLAAFWRKVFSFLDGLFVTPGAFSVYRKEVFEVLGHYQDPYKCRIEDMEIALRMQRKNLKIKHAIDAFVYTRSPSSFKSLFKQRTRWYRGFLLTIKDYLDLLNIKKHGNLSLFLSYSLICVFISIYLFIYTLQKTINYFLLKVNQLILTGFDFSSFFVLPSFKLDWYSLNFLTPLFVLTIFCIIIYLIHLSLSRKLTLDTGPIKKNAVFFIFLFFYFNTLWWISAGFSSIFRRQISCSKKD